jgi:hypothetical protein
MIVPRSLHGSSIALVVMFLPGLLRAQTAVKPSDLAGTWEWVTMKNVKTGAVDSLAKHGISWQQFTTARWMIIHMENGRAVVPKAELAKLAPEEREKVNYNKVWDDKGAQIFAARGGTYRLEGNVLYTTRVLALEPSSLGREQRFTIVRLDQKVMVWRTQPDGQGVSYEITSRRLD